MSSYFQQLARLDRPSQIVIALQFFVNASTFTSFPLISVWMTKLGHDGNLIASVLTIVLVMSKGLPLICGHYVDRLGAKRFLIAGLLIRFAGFLSLAFAVDTVPLIMTAVLLGLGAAAYESASYGLLAQGPQEQRQFLFLVNNQALNLGVILGPAIGAALIHIDLRSTFLVSSIFFLISAISAFILLPRGTSNDTGENHVIKSLFNLFSDRKFALFCVIMIPWWIVFAQLYTSFPLYYFSLTKDISSSQDIFILNGVTGVVFSIFVVLLIKKYSEMTLITSAFLILALLFMVIPFANIRILFLVIIALYTITETLILPSSDSEIGKIAKKGKEAAYFGAAHISWIIGGTIGNYIGARNANDINSFTIWYLLAVIAAIGAILSVYYMSVDRKMHIMTMKAK